MRDTFDRESDRRARSEGRFAIESANQISRASLIGRGVSPMRARRSASIPYQGGIDHRVRPGTDARQRVRRTGASPVRRQAHGLQRQPGRGVRERPPQVGRSRPRRTGIAARAVRRSGFIAAGRFVSLKPSETDLGSDPRPACRRRAPRIVGALSRYDGKCNDGFTFALDGRSNALYTCNHERTLFHSLLVGTEADLLVAVSGGARPGGGWDGPRDPRPYR